MAREDYPVTQGIRLLRTRKIAFIPHMYPFVEHGGTHHVSEYFHIPEHQVIKTLVMEKDDRRPLIILMHGDREVSVRQLARELGVKHVNPCDEKDAQRFTGYTVGGISPFGTRTAMPVYAQSSIFALDRIFINGGKRGFMVEITPADLEKTLKITKVHAAIE